MAVAVPITVAEHKKFYEVDDWCNKHTVGNWTSVRTSTEAFGSRTYYFDREKDAMLFTLKWK